jgi:hypothetical protein
MSIDSVKGRICPGEAIDRPGGGGSRFFPKNWTAWKNSWLQFIFISFEKPILKIPFPGYQMTAIREKHPPARGLYTNVKRVATPLSTPA